MTNSLWLETAGLDHVLVGSGWVATVAAIIGLVAVNNLLGSKRNKGVSGNSPDGLDVLGGAEGPAAAKGIR